MAPPFSPPPFPPPPVHVSIIDLGRSDACRQDVPFIEFSRHYNHHGATYCTIRPNPGDKFAFRIDLGPDFRFGPDDRYDRARVRVSVDRQFIRSQYFNRDEFEVRSLTITKARKFEEETGRNVEFECIVGDPHRPGPHVDDGTILVELMVGTTFYRDKHKPKPHPVHETATFRHGLVNEVKLTQGRRGFRAADVRRITPLRWYFRYADANPDTIYTDPFTERASNQNAFTGERALTGKRGRDDADQEAHDDYKRTKMTGGLGDELLYSHDLASVDIKRERSEPRELFPENNGVLYNERPYYGAFY